MGYQGGRLKDTIRVRDSKTVTIRYPGSESGGTKTETVYFEADVHIDVEAYVNSDPFDSSVARCSGEVRQLTGSVVATQTAEVASKAANSRKVAKSLIDGFFGYIRSDISQQIAELKVKTEAILYHLLQLKEQLNSRQTQMQKDYLRICDRYEITFNELDKEMKTRIHHLDKASFDIAGQATEQMMRSHSDALLNTVAVLGGENTQLQAMIYGSGLKVRSLEVLKSANRFIHDSHCLKQEIESILIDEPREAMTYAPILSVEIEQGESDIPHSQTYHSPLTLFDGADKTDQIKQELLNESQNWIAISAEDKHRIENYLNQYIQDHDSGEKQSAHAQRINKMIYKFWNQSAIQVRSN